MSAVPRACDLSMPETRRDTFALARDNMRSSTWLHFALAKLTMREWRSRYEIYVNRRSNLQI
jgi:hypothetical protein